MEYLNELKKAGVENDGAFLAILKYLSENQGWANEDFLGGLGFKHFVKGRREWVKYSPQTIGRKARKLYEMDIIEKSHDDRGHSRYRLVGSRIEPLRRVVGYESVGNNTVRPIYSHG